MHEALIRSFDGTELYRCTDETSGAALGSVLLLHGLGGHPLGLWRVGPPVPGVALWSAHTPIFAFRDGRAQRPDGESGTVQGIPHYRRRPGIGRVVHSHTPAHHRRY